MDPAVQARTALDTIHFDAAHGLHPPHQFPVPSYASERFYQYVAGWFDAVCPLLARHLAPGGCVVAAQSDNETCYLFHDQAYATDYSPDSLRLYRSMLKEYYGSIESLNAVHRRQYTDFSAVEPPRDCEVQTRADVPRHLDWVKYKEYQIRWSVARFARMLRERGIAGAPVFHDVAHQWSSPLDITAMEADPDIDWVGMNLYANKEGYHNAVTRIRYLAGSTRLPFVPEFGCGLWSHHPQTFTPEEHEFITLSALLHGLKAFNFYMLAERDRWQGSAITRHGALRADRAPFYRALNDFLQRYRFWEFERQRETIALFNYDASRYASLASTLHYAHVDLLGLPRELTEVDLDLGLGWDPRLEVEGRPGSWLEAATSWLAAHHVPFDLGDTHLTADRLSRYKLVCVPTVDFLDAQAQVELLKYVENGGQLLIGPLRPDHDQAFNPCTTLSRHLAAPGTTAIGKGALTWAIVPSLPDHLARLAPRVEYACDQPRVDLAVHRRGDQTLLFAVNPTAQTLETTLSFSGAQTFQSAWRTTPSLSGESQVTVSLPAYTVHIWGVRRD
jgi:beta-galactosidase